MFQFGKSKVNRISMDTAAEEIKKDNRILLIDVRTKEEYSQGHIPRSTNIPLDRISDIEKAASDKNQKIFVYCHSGMRSSNACGQLKKIGYTNVFNIGGIIQWQGPIE